MDDIFFILCQMLLGKAKKYFGGAYFHQTFSAKWILKFHVLKASHLYHWSLLVLFLSYQSSSWDVDLLDLGLAWIEPVVTFVVTIILPTIPMTENLEVQKHFHYTHSTPPLKKGKNDFFLGIKHYIRGYWIVPATINYPFTLWRIQLHHASTI